MKTVAFSLLSFVAANDDALNLLQTRASMVDDLNISSSGCPGVNSCPGADVFVPSAHLTSLGQCLKFAEQLHLGARRGCPKGRGTNNAACCRPIRRSEWRIRRCLCYSKFAPGDQVKTETFYNGKSFPLNCDYAENSRRYRCRLNGMVLPEDAPRPWKVPGFSQGTKPASCLDENACRAAIHCTGLKWAGAGNHNSKGCFSENGKLFYGTVNGGTADWADLGDLPAGKVRANTCGCNAVTCNFPQIGGPAVRIYPFLPDSTCPRGLKPIATAPPAREPVVSPPPAKEPVVSPPPAADSCVETEMDKANWIKPFFNTEAEVVTACKANAKCLGYFQGGSRYAVLVPGGRFWSAAKRKPNGTVKSVKRC